MLDLSVIVLNYNTKDITLKCLESVYQSATSLKYNLWVVDNASGDGSCRAILKQYPHLKLIQSKTNLGFSGGNNLALREAYKQASYCLLLNSDTIVAKTTLSKLIEFARNGNYGIASCKLVDVNHQLQPNAGMLPGLFPMLFWLSGLDDLTRPFFRLPSYQERYPKYYRADKPVEWVSGTAMLIKKEVVEAIGLLDDRIFMYGEDVDYCWRARLAGFKVGWTNHAQITHLGGASCDAPKYRQWLGEFRGLLYLYNKYYGRGASLALKLLICFFVILRVVAFGLLGNREYAKTYFKLLTSL